MDLLGDLWAWFTGVIYELRIPVLILSVVAMVALAVVARRRGWFAAARRHPGRSVAVGAVVLALALPLGWYLASPVFIRTELEEPSPVAVTVAPTASPSPAPTPARTAEATPAPAESTPSPTPSPTPFASTVLASGRFHGSDEFHFGRGTASIIETAPGRFHLRLEDFSVRNGPDLYVYLSPDADGYAKGALELGTLKATDGSFGYDLPEGTDPSDFASAVIWCKQFSHLFATAPFEAA